MKIRYVRVISSKNTSIKTDYLTRAFFLFWFVLCSVQIHGQERDINKDSTRISKSKLTISDFSQVRTFWSEEQHSNFAFKYNINPRLFLELQGYYDTYLLADVFRVPIIAKKVCFEETVYVFWNRNRI